MGRIEDKVALITGGSSGIGQATALLFAKEGAKVVVAAHQVTGSLEETVAMIKASGGEASFVEADVSKSAEVENMVKTTVDTYGRLDILFNNAGNQQSLGTTVETSEEDFDRVINVNLKGVFLGMKYGIPQMLKTGGGSIVNTASINAFIAFTNVPVYSAAKSGVVMLTKTAAMEYVNQNIRVNCVCPGFILTPRSARVRSDPKFESVAPTWPKSPVGRPGRPEEVAQAVLFLASDESSYTTGTVLFVDGGITAL